MTIGSIRLSTATTSLAMIFVALCTTLQVARGQTRFATSDSASGYVHWIELYDDSNTRIDPTAENPKPYSPMRTCGRCHDYNTISHGWHFNATDPAAMHGRPGQPWVWSDPITGTHLPLSYRGWAGTHNPDALGLSRWQVAAKFGGFLPGGGVGSKEAMDHSPVPQSPENNAVNRSAVTGELPVDCMLCHRNQGSGYSPFVWTEQISYENFAYAPSAALGLATVTGTRVSRLKDDFDPSSPDASSMLPKVVYESSKFRKDGTVFFDLVRKPKSDACYYCHTNESASQIGGERWLHDEDVHLRAGLACADCHRNALDHQTVRGFDGEQHVAGSMVASLSCQGCHLGADESENDLARAGRFGAPQPAHRGLPPLHFEKMTCTACHSGTLPQQVVPRQVNSIIHRLGDHIKRTGNEFPGIVGPVQLPVSTWGTEPGEVTDAHSEQRYAPHRLLWPSFWGTLREGKLKALDPKLVYDLVRSPLKVRREFTEDLSEVKLLLSQRKEILGEERARLKEEDWTEEEKGKLATAESKVRKTQIGERMAESLAAIETEFPDSQAVYVTGGMGFVRKGEAEIEALATEKLGSAAQPYAWPIGHNVRPARQSLGATGCLECHSEGSLFFQTEIRPVGLLPEQATVSIKAHEMQAADMLRLGSWNQLFAGRSSFKIAGLVAMALTCLIALSAFAWSVGGVWRRRSHGQDPK